MAKPLLMDGIPHRIQRSKLVAIPPEWVGQVTSHQTIHKRASKDLRKHRKRAKSYGRPSMDERREKVYSKEARRERRE